jgi:hypothetical protein
MEDKNHEQANINIDKMAWIGIYNAHVEHQHIHMEEKHTSGEPAVEFMDAEEAKDDVTQKHNDEDLVDRLKPLFYNNEDDVRQFLKEIDGMKDNDITDLVNRWVKAKRISDYGNSRKGVLWGILHEAGLYSKSKSNWNGRVM